MQQLATCLFQFSRTKVDLNTGKTDVKKGIYFFKPCNKRTDNGLKRYREMTATCFIMIVIERIEVEANL